MLSVTVGFTLALAASGPSSVESDASTVAVNHDARQPAIGTLAELIALPPLAGTLAVNEARFIVFGPGFFTLYVRTSLVTPSGCNVPVWLT